MSEQKGKISQIIGQVVDVTFNDGGDALPKIYDSLEIKKESGEKIIVECQQHIGENSIRAIAMDSTDGLKRGMEVIATGSPIQMPIGDGIKGRLLNVVGDAIDGIGQLSKENQKDWINVIQSVKNSDKGIAIIYYLKRNFKKEIVNPPCYSSPAVQFLIAYF